MEQIIFIIIVVVVGLVRLIAQAAENKRNAEADKRDGAAPVQTSTTLASRGAPQTEEERVRKFFEALGVPTAADPPPKVQPRQITPKPAPIRKILPVDPFPRPRGLTGEPGPPLVITPPPLPAAPRPIRETIALPTRETSVLVLPREPKPDFTRVAEFEVRDIDEAIAEDSFSHAGLRTDKGQAPARVASPSFAARLGTAQGLRDAMVLREIFGPPRSMQAL